MCNYFKGKHNMNSELPLNFPWGKSLPQTCSSLTHRETVAVGMNSQSANEADSGLKINFREIKLTLTKTWLKLNLLYNFLL